MPFRNTSPKPREVESAGRIEAAHEGNRRAAPSAASPQVACALAAEEKGLRDIEEEFGWLESSAVVVPELLGIADRCGVAHEDLL